LLQWRSVNAYAPRGSAALSSSPDPLRVASADGEGRGDPDRLAREVTNLVDDALGCGTPIEPVTGTSVITEPRA
jgi:hypothetical protein